MPPMRAHPASPPAALDLPAACGVSGATPMLLPPTQVWPALSPALQGEIRQALLHLLQEVLRDA